MTTTLTTPLSDLYENTHTQLLDAINTIEHHGINNLDYLPSYVYLARIAVTMTYTSTYLRTQLPDAIREFSDSLCDPVVEQLVGHHACEWMKNTFDAKSFERAFTMINLMDCLGVDHLSPHAQRAFYHATHTTVNHQS